MIIGIDFDNTIIDYSNLFEIVAKKKKYKLNSNLNKASLKKFLIKNKKENEWTIIQGEVYGKYIIGPNYKKDLLNF